MKRIFLIIVLLGTALLAEFTRTNLVVSDTTTNLEWSDHEVLEKDWMEAITYCENLTLDTNDNWRLPNIQELFTIVGGKDVKDSSYPNSLNSIFENGSILDKYWSSTTIDNIKNSAYRIYVRYGTTETSSKTNSNNVRCVRNMD